MVFDQGAGSELYGAYAAGNLDAALSLLIETQACLRDDLQMRLDQADAVAGVFLEDERPEPLSFGALDRALAAIDAIEAPDKTKGMTSEKLLAAAEEELIHLPEPIRDLAVSGAEKRGWKFAGPGLRIMNLPVDSSAEVELLRIDPGFGAPTHTHSGSEYTLVLAGGFTDEIASYGPGEISIAGPGIVHRPIADPGETCFALAVRDGDLEFTGVLGLLQKIARKHQSN